LTKQIPQSLVITQAIAVSTSGRHQ